MSSKTRPLRLHIALLNSLRSIDILGGGQLKVTELHGQFSRNIETHDAPFSSSVVHNHLHRLSEIYFISWKSKGNGEAKTVSEIVKELEKDGCPDVFLKSLTIIRPWTKYTEYLMENVETNKSFTFHPHPFKPSVFSRLKGRMPSLRLYSRMKELRKILSVDLDDDTKKRWRDILLVNYPHQSFSNQEIRQLWGSEPCCILLKESKGKFTLMEVEESRV